MFPSSRQSRGEKRFDREQFQRFFRLRLSCTSYVPLSGVFTDSGGLERFDFGQIVDGEGALVIDSRRLHHL